MSTRPKPCKPNASRRQRPICRLHSPTFVHRPVIIWPKTTGSGECQHPPPSLECHSHDYFRVACILLAGSTRVHSRGRVGSGFTPHSHDLHATERSTRSPQGTQLPFALQPNPWILVAQLVEVSPWLFFGKENTISPRWISRLYPESSASVLSTIRQLQKPNLN